MAHSNVCVFMPWTSPFFNFKMLTTSICYINFWYWQEVPRSEPTKTNANESLIDISDSAQLFLICLTRVYPQRRPIEKWKQKNKTISSFTVNSTAKTTRWWFRHIAGYWTNSQCLFGPMPGFWVHVNPVCTWQMFQWWVCEVCDTNHLFNNRNVHSMFFFRTAVCENF